jgi:hypothetical protein
MKRGFCLSVCVDFFDELILGSYDRARIAALFALFRDAGVRRVYWIYTHRFADGSWARCPWAGICENAAVTQGQIGEFLPAAVSIAHELGMEIYAVYKPFDLAHLDSFPFGSEGARKFGIGLQSLSGELYWGLNTLTPYAHMRMTRRSDDLPADLPQRRIARIRFVGRDDSPTRLTPEHLTLTLSRDNGKYQRYDGPLTFRDAVESGRRVVTLDGLRIDEPFVAVHTPFRDEGATLRNQVGQLVQVQDDLGRPMPVTLGLVSRDDLHRAHLSNHTGLTLWSEKPTEGYQFNMPDFQAPERPMAAVDNRRGYLAIARGKERHIAGALAPAFEAVHDLWLSHIRDCLDAGVDGVDLRVAQHNRCLAWDEYGYEQPILNEYQRRHGTSDPARMDRGKQEAILAERYTAFYQKAAALIRSRGKRVQLHVNLLGARYMGMTWDWPGWIEQGLADEITLKDVWPGDREKLALILPHAQSRGIALHTCPWLVDQKDADLRATLPDRLRAAAAGSEEQGFIAYESASIAAIEADGKPRMFLPSVLEALRACGG